MKKYLYIILVICFTIVSCGESPSSKLEKKATEAFKESFKNVSENDKDARIESINTVFSNDSLCILHINIKSKNKLGVDVIDKVEYIFLSQYGKFFEAFQDLKEDSVYISEPTLKKISKGEFYENLDFANAILYRSSMYINTNGREVGNHDSEFFIPVPTATGMWELDAYDDEFGDKTTDKFIRLTGKGQFSNSVATNDKLVVFLFLDKEYIFLRFVEYGSQVVKNSEICNMKIKDSDGIIHDFSLWSMSDGHLEPFRTQQKEFRGILEKEGEISAVVTMNDFTETTYQFKLQLNGLKKAMSFL